jgi:hypothetical protein
MIIAKGIKIWGCVVVVIKSFCITGGFCITRFVIVKSGFSPDFKILSGLSIRVMLMFREIRPKIRQPQTEKNFAQSHCHTTDYQAKNLSGQSSGFSNIWDFCLDYPSGYFINLRHFVWIKSGIGPKIWPILSG